MVQKRITLTEQSDKEVKKIKEKYGISYSGALNMIITLKKEQYAN